MCGIAGVISRKESEDFHLIEVSKVLASLAHRGPDNYGYIKLKNSILFHTRLAIIDLNPNANQPMRSSKSEVTITFNGEIYNYKDIKRDLQTQGVNFSTHSDTEVIISAYLKYGTKAFEMLQGDFAFCLVDDEKKKKFLVRDSLGIKPVYYCLRDRNIYFASEITALRSLINEKLARSNQFLSEFLWFGSSVSDQSYFEEIKSLPPGCIMEIAGSGSDITVRKFNSDSSITSADPDPNWIDLVHNAVSKQSMSDVPMCMLLSGGIDSCILADGLVEHGIKIKAYTALYSDLSNKADVERAEQIARFYNLDHEVLTISGEISEQSIRAVARCMGEPFSDASIYTLDQLYSQIPLTTKVILQGDGGDEVFAGYRRHNISAKLQIYSVISRLFKFAPAQLNRFFEAINQEDPTRRALLLTTDTLKHSMHAYFKEDLSSHLMQNYDAFSAFKMVESEFPCSFSELKKQIFSDLRTQLKCQYLPKVDRISMKNSKEVRVPILDKTILNNLNTSKVDKFNNGFQGKLPLRKYLSNKLPKSIHRGKKLGFQTPFSSWLRSGLKDISIDFLLGDSFVNEYSIKKDSLEKLILKHNKFETNYREQFILWKFFSLSNFYWNVK